MSFLQIDPNSDFSYQNLPFGIFSTSQNVSLSTIYQVFIFDEKPEDHA
jgi:hypothetical protein